MWKVNSWCRTCQQRNCATWLDWRYLDALIDSKLLWNFLITFFQMVVTFLTPLYEPIRPSIANELSNSTHWGSDPSVFLHHPCSLFPLLRYTKRHCLRIEKCQLQSVLKLSQYFMIVWEGLDQTAHFKWLKCLFQAWIAPCGFRVLKVRIIPHSPKRSHIF